MNERTSIFSDTDFSIEGFAPSAPKATAKAEEVRKVAEKEEFSSREPEKKSKRREPRRYRTGRNVQLPFKVTQAVLDDIYRLTDAAPEGQRVAGLTIEKAVAALKRERAAGQG
jgi:hypothetical protein